MDVPVTSSQSDDEAKVIIEQLLKEGKPIPPPVEFGIAFDEEWYLQTYRDIAEAVAAGRCPSVLLHYLRHGKQEGRCPVPRETDRGTEGPDEFSLRVLSRKHKGAHYLCPSELSGSPMPIRRFLVVGSCLLSAMGFAGIKFFGNCESDFILTNHVGTLPENPPHDASSYDLQVIQIALRSVMHDSLLWHIPFSDVRQHQVAFDTARNALALQLDCVLEWNRKFGIPTFVMNFLVPQQNPLGRFMPRYDLRNPAFFVEQLNSELSKMLNAYQGAYLLDIDNISASLGRRYIQDDGVAISTHNSVMFTPGKIEGRIEPLLPMSDHYEIKWSPIFADAIWEEISAMYRTLRQMDAVKLVVVDLDDTLWEGVSGEMDNVGPEMIEGWPIGVAEALAYLKKRGVLLAIVSKNDDQRVSSRWDNIFRGRLHLSDFATRRINWRPKVENMQEILADVNLLPRSVVYIDDNPVERTAMQRAFPDMRVIGRYPYYLKRILLWSPETQAPTITSESSRRTEMIQAQIDRDALRHTLSREEFLKSLGVKLNIFQVRPSDATYARTFELLNKTNQFNTTGKRWKSEEIRAALASGMEIFAFDVEDKYTGYGLVGVLLIQEGTIAQFVMSCRVVGLDVEFAALATIIELMRTRGAREIRVLFATTDANLLCRDVLPAAGFKEWRDHWVLRGAVTRGVPPHITVHLN